MVHAWVSERTLRVLLSSCRMELNMVSIMLFDRSSQVDRVRSFRRDQDGWGREGEAGFIKNLLCGQILSACKDAFCLFQAFLFFFGERFVLFLFLFFDNQTRQAANLASGVKIINITFAITGELTVAVNSSYGFTGSYSQLLTHIINWMSSPSQYSLRE